VLSLSSAYGLYCWRWSNAFTNRKMPIQIKELYSSPDAATMLGIPAPLLIRA
jgi:hypothetical protein